MSRHSPQGERQVSASCTTYHEKYYFSGLSNIFSNLRQQIPHLSMLLQPSTISVMNDDQREGSSAASLGLSKGFPRIPFLPGIFYIYCVSCEYRFIYTTASTKKW
jgi:hypothetical protein